MAQLAFVTELRLSRNRIGSAQFATTLVSLELDLLENTMPQTKTPTSSLSGNITTESSLCLTMITTTAIELLVKKAWYRTLARIRRGVVFPESSTTDPSPATKLPLEVVEIIITHLIYDTHSLRACTQTCYSWYIVAVPHLHHTLITGIDCWGQNYRWPNPIKLIHTLGLLPLVEEFCVRQQVSSDHVGLSLKLFNRRTLHQFSALTNIRRLEIEYLDIPSFIPGIQQYFGHFSPTVEFLLLKQPRGSRRQIIYFIGLFQHLQSLSISYRRANAQDDPTLVPLFIPPLRGILKMSNFPGVYFLKDMIDLFEGIRFHYVILYNMEGMQLLLGACAKTLEGLKLYPADPRGE